MDEKRSTEKSFSIDIIVSAIRKYHTFFLLIPFQKKKSMRRDVGLKIYTWIFEEMKRKNRRNVIDDVIIINGSLIMIRLLEITYEYMLFGSYFFFSFWFWDRPKLCPANRLMNRILSSFCSISLFRWINISVQKFHFDCTFCICSLDLHLPEMCLFYISHSLSSLVIYWERVYSFVIRSNLTKNPQ